ncbi:MAG: tRNA pseudouridine(38-40) synthase TruA [Chitinispirillales bacterium]|jgi:tRNA pseudouridine38-40 synthase|nr:tRNA pseudouridine(38-40) synthase TruA [Chitinispirillales bacterium]
MRLFSRVEYDGTNFSGWQIQPNNISVQGELEKAVLQIVGRQISITGSGRTDAGVHARNQGIHFDIPDEICGKFLDLKKFSYQINSVLPQTIAVFEMQKVKDDFHARFSAVERTYHYYISLKKNPLSANSVVFFGYKLDLRKIEQELQGIIGTHYFKAFCSSNNQLDRFFCTVNSAELINISKDLFYIKISANRFLYNMVRTIVGTLIDISRGKINSTLLEIIDKNDRKLAGINAPAKGLVLENVRYECLY